MEFVYDWDPAADFEALECVATQKLSLILTKTASLGAMLKLVYQYLQKRCPVDSESISHLARDCLSL